MILYAMPSLTRIAPRLLVLSDLTSVRKSILETAADMNVPALEATSPSAAFHALDGDRSIDIVVVALRTTGNTLLELLGAVRERLGIRRAAIIVVISPGQIRHCAALFQHADDLDFKPIKKTSLTARLVKALHRLDKSEDVESAKTLRHDIPGNGERAATSVSLSPSDTGSGELATKDTINDRAGFVAALDATFTDLELEIPEVYSVVCLDLDRLRNINYSFGYRIGDQLLQAVANRLRQWATGISDQLTQAPLCAHLSGSLFGILMRGVSSSQQALHLTKSAQKSLQETPFILAEHQIYVTASAGIAMSERENDASDVILRNADAALRRAKSVGRGASTLYDSTMQTHATAFLKMETALRHALGNDELRVFFQPIIRLDTETIAGFEALVRWPRGDGSYFDTNEFIIIAEQTGLVTTLDRFVLREACRQVRSWNTMFRRKEPLTVSVNVSGTNFMQPGMLADIDGTLRSFGLYGRSLRLEITETSLMETASYAADLLQHLRAMNVGISVDDFGTGYSSLAYLRRFEIDTLKISSAFVTKMDSDQDSWEIVRTILNLANNLGKQAVAEGVETQRQKELLLALRCPLAQGFFFSEAVDAQKAQELLAAEARGENPFLASQLPQASNTPNSE